LLQGCVKVDILRIGLDQQQWLVGALLIDHRKIGRQRHAVFGQADLEVGGAPVGALENVAFAVFIELKATRQHFVDPGHVQLGELRVFQLQRFAPFLVGLAQTFALGGIKFFQPLRKGFLQNGNGEERAGDLDQRQPIIMHADRTHAAPP
jgi:hypothetical protein